MRDATPCLDLRTGRVVMPREAFSVVDQIRFAEVAAQPKPPSRWKRFEFGEMPSRAHYEWYATRGVAPDAKRANLPGWVIDRVISRDGNACGICGDPVEEPPHIDHVHPRSHGGSDLPTNLQIAHPACNLRKGARAA